MKQSEILNDWKHRTCALATMHGKETVISPIVSQELGMTITVPANFNTDYFGTFTRDIARTGDQREAARMKALAAMDLTELDLAIASEGSFGAHPHIPFVSSNLELVLLLDKKNGLEIIGHHRSSNVKVQNQKVYTSGEAVVTAESWGFPIQGIIIRQSEKNNRGIYKEIRTIDELKKISETLLSGWFTKSIFLETDMRAHRCPPRMESIRAATLDLVKNCLSVCPQCAIPGFVIIDVVKGLPCSHCGLPTDIPIESIYSCQKCEHREHKRIKDETLADPGQCAYCNP